MFHRHIRRVKDMNLSGENDRDVLQITSRHLFCVSSVLSRSSHCTCNSHRGYKAGFESSPDTPAVKDILRCCTEVKYQYISKCFITRCCL